MKQSLAMMGLAALSSSFVFTSASSAQAAASECGIPTSTYYPAQRPYPERVGSQLKAYGNLPCNPGTGNVSFQTTLKWQSPYDQKYYTIGTWTTSSGATSPTGLKYFLSEATYNCHGDKLSGFLVKTYYVRDGVLISALNHNPITVPCFVYPPAGTPGF